MLDAAGGTGVAHYARALGNAQAAVSERPRLLSGASAFGDPHAPVPTILRTLRALVPGARRAHRLAGEDAGPGTFQAADLFRLAQVYFDIYRALLPVRLPGPPGIMHWTYPVPLIAPGWRNLYTIHDVIPLTAPGLTPIDPARHRRVLALLTAQADRLVTVSDAARGEIVRVLGCPASLVVNCAQPVDLGPVGGGGEPLTAGLQPHGYFLVCGSVEPRKNVAAVAAAHARSGTALPLVVAGPDGWGADRIAPMLDRPGIVRLAYRTRPELLALIRQARALLMPSLAEGFGLPVAEAMTLGTPVLVSRDPALLETAGGAAHVVDAADVDAIAKGILRLASEESYCAALAAAGLEQAGRFAPRVFAARIGGLYRELAGQEGGD